LTTYIYQFIVLEHIQQRYSGKNVELKYDLTIFLNLLIEYRKVASASYLGERENGNPGESLKKENPSAIFKSCDYLESNNIKG